MDLQTSYYAIVLILSHFSIAVIFLFLGISSLFLLGVENKSQVSKLVMMCISSAILALALATGAIPEINTSYGNQLYVICWGFGLLSYFYYLSVIQDFLNIRSKLFNIAKNIYLTGVGVFLLDIIFFLSTNKSFLNTDKIDKLSILHITNNFTMNPNHLGILIQLIFGSAFLVCVSIIAKKLKADHPKEKLLKFGIAISVLGLANDTLLGSGILTLTFPLTFLGNFFEAVRLTTHFQYRAREKVKILRGELSRVAKAAQVGLVAGSIAHDIRNPLSVITGTSGMIQDLIKENYGENEDIDKRFKLLNKNTSRIENIISCYMRLLHHDSLAPTEFTKLKTIVEEAVEIAAKKINIAHMEIRMNIDDKILLDCQASEMILVITNLINNSCDELSESPDSWVNFSVVKQENHYLFEVTDSGLGIPKQNWEKIFQMQFTSKKKGDGAGLGLGIVKEILARRSCEIYLDTKSKNTKFVIKIPRAQIKQSLAQAS